jgi:hypothetical protein
MFTEFKNFYSKLSSVVPDVTFRGGRHAFLHRARVAREQEDIESFRHLRNELIQYWYAYIDQEERKKNDMNARLSKMLDTDIYPSHEREDPPQRPQDTRRCSSATAGSAKSPILLDTATMAKEGIPMTGNLDQSSFDANTLALQNQQHIFPRQHVGCSMRVALGAPPTRQQMQQQIYLMHRAQQAHAARQQHQMRDLSRLTPLQLLAQQKLSHQPSSRAPPVHTPSVPSLPTQTEPDAAVELSTTDLYAAPSTAQTAAPTDPDPLIDDIDVGCYAHVNLSADWYASQAEPGPSVLKQRRVDSGFEESETVEDASASASVGRDVDIDMGVIMSGLEGGDGSYVGKGKGRMGVGVGVGGDVISID